MTFNIFELLYVDYSSPLAYIASCHRFREQFTSILFSHIMNSPPNSAYHQNSQHNNQQKHRSSSSSTRCSRTKSQRGQFYSNSISRVSVRTFGPTSPKATNMDTNPSGTTRNSISVAANNTSSGQGMSRSLAGSIKSKSSLKKTTSVRRKNSRGRLGAEFIIVDCDSTAILQEQDSSNSSNPTGETADINNGVTQKSTSIYYSNFETAVRTVDDNSPGRLNTILQSYSYEFTDLGHLV